MLASTRPLVRWILAGVLATLTMDVGSTLVRRTGFTAGLTPAVMGRWFALLARGQFQHHTIAEAPPVPAEMPIALVTHYLIGVSLALVFWGLVTVLHLQVAPAKGFALALVFGLLTNLLPWLWMFPSMGFGAFGRTGPPELMLFRTSLVNHLLFGLGLGAATCWLELWRS